MLDRCNLYSEIKYERKRKKDGVHIGKENGNVTNLKLRNNKKNKFMNELHKSQEEKQNQPNERMFPTKKVKALKKEYVECG